VRRAFAYATGTPSGSNNRQLLEFLSEGFAGSGYVLPDLLREIALSSAFRRAYEPEVREIHPSPDLTSAQYSGPMSNADLAASVVP
jgi:hypothetical protein